jgi:hypothetical protein
MLWWLVIPMIVIKAATVVLWIATWRKFRRLA